MQNQICLIKAGGLEEISIQESPSNSQGKTDQNRYKRKAIQNPIDLRVFAKKAIKCWNGAFKGQHLLIPMQFPKRIQLQQIEDCKSK